MHKPASIALDLDDAMNTKEAERFIYREARLMDEHQYDEWLSLWTKDAFYWVPCNHQQQEFDNTASIIYDRRMRLEDRVARLKSGDVLAQDPKTTMRRVLSNVEIDCGAGSEITTSSNFILVQARGSNQIIWCGRSIHTLRRDDGALKIARKKVLLVNSEQEMPTLQFLI